VRDVARVTIAGAILAIAGGAIFWAIHGGTTATRAIAYGFWFAAAACIVLIAVAGNKLLWRRTKLNLPEGWVFGTSAVVLTLAGAAIDVA
jgi:hypothetical protein